MALKLTNPCQLEYIKMPCPLLIFNQSDYLIQIVDINSHNSVDLDQLASEEAISSGSTLFAKVGHNRVQQDQGNSL